MNKPDPARAFKAAQPSVQMAFACEDVTSDPGGPVSFKNIMDGIGAVDFPATTGRWFAVFCFYSELEHTVANARVVVSDASGEVVAQTAVKDLTFTADRPMSRNVVAFAGLAWPYPGRYRIEFIANRDDVLAAFPMWVQHVPATDEEDQLPPTGEEPNDVPQ